MSKRKYYNYIPIYKKSEMPEIKNVGDDEELSSKRHELREKDALTELIAQISDVCDTEKIRELFARLSVKLVEDDADGGRVITASFSNKRFY